MSEKIETESSIEELLYQFSRLYERWTLEQQQIGKREAELLKAIESFNEQLDLFSELEARARHDIQTSVSKAAIVASDVIKNQVHLEISNEKRDFFEYWKPLTNTLLKQIQTLEKMQERAAWIMLAVVGVSGFVVGMILMYLMMK